GSNSANLHSRPGYYGALVALWCGIPAFLILIVWNMVEPSFLEQVVLNHLPQDISANLDPASLGAVVDRVQARASGFGVSDTPAAYEQGAAEQLAKFLTSGTFAKWAVVISPALAGLVRAKKRISQEFRAGNQVEKMINIGSALCSGVAILTTLG